MSQLVTGEAVELDLRPAALPSRLVAGLVDAAAQLAILLVLALLTVAVAPSASSAAVTALGVVVFLAATAGYPVLFETLWRGRTPGKAAMGLRVVRDDGGPIRFRQALVRGLASVFLERPGITLFLGGIVCSLLNSQGKRIGDLLAGTVVLQERVAVRGGAVAVMPPQLAPWAADADLAGLSDQLAASVRTFVSRADQLTPSAREQLGSQLVASVAAVVSPPAPPGTPGWAYLAAVLAERRRRAERQLAPPSPATAQPTPLAAPSPPESPTTTGGFALPG